VTTNSFFHTKTWVTDPDVLLLQPEPVLVNIEL